MMRNSSSVQWWVCGALMLSLVVLSAAVRVATAGEFRENGRYTLQQPQEHGQAQPESAQPPAGDDEERPPFRRLWSRFGTDSEYARNHVSVRRAFQEISHAAQSSIVRIYCDNAEVVLGTVVDSHGYILTKNSELKSNPQCHFADGRKLPAELVTVNEPLDVAVLRVDAVNLTPITWRVGDPPSVGSWLITPDTRELPVAVGVVSTEPRPIPRPRAMLGVQLQDADEGALIGEVLPQSPAEKAGLQKGDVIIEVQGKPIPNRQTLIETLRQWRPNDQVTVVVRRNGERHEVTVTLTDEESLEGRRNNVQNSLGGPLSRRRWDFPAVIEHDTVLRPSQCGGPVLDVEGRAVGINIARAGRVVSYALPYSVLAPLLQEIKSGKFGPVGDLSEKELAAHIERLRQLVSELTRQHDSLARQIAERQTAAASGSEEAQQELAKLQQAAAQVQSQLEMTMQQLQRFEKVGVVSTEVSKQP